MKKFFIVFLFLSVNFLGASLGFSETETTQITSKGKLILDYKKYVAEFFENVLVRDAGGTLKSDYLQVFFTPTGDTVEKMIAKGHVLIDQKEHSSKSGSAEFFSREGKIILRDNPIIRKGENEYAADIITIFTHSNQVNFEPSARIVIRKSKQL
jgi:lipopolysaccharide export system protein LptA